MPSLALETGAGATGRGMRTAPRSQNRPALPRSLRKQPALWAPWFWPVRPVPAPLSWCNQINGWVGGQRDRWMLGGP